MSPGKIPLFRKMGRKNAGPLRRKRRLSVDTWRTMVGWLIWPKKQEVPPTHDHGLQREFLHFGCCVTKSWQSFSHVDWFSQSFTESKIGPIRLWYWISNDLSVFTFRTLNQRVGSSILPRPTIPEGISMLVPPNPMPSSINCIPGAKEISSLARIGDPGIHAREECALLSVLDMCWRIVFSRRESILWS